MGDLLDLGLARSIQPFGFRGPIPPGLLAHFRHILIEPSDLCFDLAQFALGVRFGGRRFHDARRDFLCVATEERAPVLCDQVGDAPKYDEEVKPAKNQARGRIGGIGLSALRGKRGKRQEKENQESTRSKFQEAPEGFHRAPLPWELPGPKGPPARMASAISFARAPLDCSSSARAALTSSAMPFFASWRAV